MKVKELTVEQLKILIEETIEEKLEEILGDPDKGLELREEIIKRLEAHKASKKPRISMEEVARRHGLELK